MMEEERSQVVAFTLGEEELALPIDIVREIVVFDRLSALPGSPEYVVGVFNLRGRIIPLIDIGCILRVEHPPPGPEGKAIVLEHEGRTFAVYATSISRIYTAERVDRPPEPLRGEYVQGVVSVDGRNLVLLDLRRLFGEGTPLTKEDKWGGA